MTGRHFTPVRRRRVKMPGRHTQREETTRRLEQPRLRRATRLSALRLEAVRASPGPRYGRAHALRAVSRRERDQLFKYNPQSALPKETGAPKVRSPGPVDALRFQVVWFTS